MKPVAQNRILIIDDDEHILEVISEFLASNGFDVSVAGTGEKGLETLANIHPDLILLDVNMPGMGGIGFLRRIMSSNGSLNYPVLVFTSRSTTEDYFHGIPVDGFITKPCDQSELLSSISDIIKRHLKAVMPTILIGEDDPTILENLARGFRKAGFKIEEAATGPEVLEKAAVCLPDAVLVKQILSGMNGDLAASILRHMPGTQSIPVILYDNSRVAKTLEEETHLRHTLGIAMYLNTDKTVVLLNAVKKVLSTHR